MLYSSFIELDTRMAKNQKVFKRVFSALSALDKTVTLRSHCLLTQVQHGMARNKLQCA